MRVNELNGLNWYLLSKRDAKAGNVPWNLLKVVVNEFVNVLD